MNRRLSNNKTFVSHLTGFCEVKSCRDPTTSDVPFPDLQSWHGTGDHPSKNPGKAALQINGGAAQSGVVALISRGPMPCRIRPRPCKMPGRLADVGGPANFSAAEQIPICLSNMRYWSDRFPQRASTSKDEAGDLTARNLWVCYRDLGLILAWQASEQVQLPERKRLASACIWFGYPAGQPAACVVCRRPGRPPCLFMISHAVPEIMI